MRISDWSSDVCSSDLDRDTIAPSRRFYAGGGGSVRGYGYQDIGPRDANDDPIGGRGLAELSVEARIRFGNFGVVPFIDAGNFYTDFLPSLHYFQVGAGLGVRFYHSSGPLPVDIGTTFKILDESRWARVGPD